MLRRILLPAVMLLAAVFTAPSASAFDGAYPYPFMYGFYQPYGIRYSTSVRTPPYFAVNPPVYYGARHTRPYGASPFASPPLVEAGPGYRTRQSDAVAPPVLMCNPHCDAAVEIEELAPPAEATEQPVVRMGPLQTNPFVATAESHVAKK